MDPRTGLDETARREKNTCNAGNPTSVAETVA
jgi:hypothetical protein